jgi:hypothetical protein
VFYGAERDLTAITENDYKRVIDILRNRAYNGGMPAADRSWCSFLDTPASARMALQDAWAACGFCAAILAASRLSRRGISLGSVPRHAGEGTGNAGPHSRATDLKQPVDDADRRVPCGDLLSRLALIPTITVT